MPESDREILKAILYEAGEIALRHFGNSPKFWVKADKSRVGEADLEVNAFLIDALTKAYPDAHFLSEEALDSEERTGCAQLFIIDPIDGTEAFLKERPHFSIAVALVCNSELRASAIYAPALDEMYSAQKGKGSFLNKKPLPLSMTPDSEVILAANASYNAPLLAQMTRYEFDSFPSMAYRFAKVATGAYLGSFTLRPAWDWDVAAGDLICREAGLRVVDLQGHALRYNAATPRQSGIFMGKEELVDEMLNKYEDIK